MKEPKQVTEIMKHSQIDNGKLLQNHSQNLKQWSAETEKICLALFTRLADLFGDLAKSKGLEIKKDKSNEYTREFKLWCQKLSDLSIEEITRGIEALEFRIEHSARDGVKSFPPSYAEFRGLCYLAPNSEGKYRTWGGLPKSVMTNEERKEEMQKLRKKMGL